MQVVTRLIHLLGDRMLGNFKKSIVPKMSDSQLGMKLVTCCLFIILLLLDYPLYDGFYCSALILILRDISAE